MRTSSGAAESRRRHLRRHWVTRGLDQRKSDLSDLRTSKRPNSGKPEFGLSILLRKRLFAKQMDCRVISAFTRVFDALCPAMTSLFQFCVRELVDAIAP
jgi:hypothetical protein